MDDDLKKQLSRIANAIRSLSIDAVQKANSGHPGMPMGCAELGAFLYGILLKHNPKHSQWVYRRGTARCGFILVCISPALNYHWTRSSGFVNSTLKLRDILNME